PEPKETSPMTVRSKPLLILSGLFLVIAMVGLMAMAVILAPRANPLPMARAERAAGKFRNAEIHFRQALQRDGKDAQVLEEMPGLYADGAKRDPAERAKHRQLQLKYLGDAARYDKRRLEPRRQLLVDAIRHDEVAEAARWAEQVLPLDAGNADALYV